MGGKRTRSERATDSCLSRCVFNAPWNNRGRPAVSVARSQPGMAGGE